MSDKIKEIRERMLEQQNGFCALCCAEAENPVLDHCHKDGYFRAVLCRDCNQIEGKINSAFKRFGTKMDDAQKKALLALIWRYWNTDYSRNGIHPLHRFPEHKEIKKLKSEIKKAKREDTIKKKNQRIKELRAIIKEKRK